MGVGRSTGSATVPVTFQCVECSLRVTLGATVGKDYIYEESVRDAEQELVQSCGWFLDGHAAYCACCRPEKTEVKTDWVTWISGSYRATVRDDALILEISHNGGGDWLIMTQVSARLGGAEWSSGQYELNNPSYQGTRLRAVLHDRLPYLVMSGA